MTLAGSPLMRWVELFVSANSAAISSRWCLFHWFAHIPEHGFHGFVGSLNTWPLHRRESKDQNAAGTAEYVMCLFQETPVNRPTSHYGSIQVFLGLGVDPQNHCRQKRGMGDFLLGLRTRTGQGHFLTRFKSRVLKSIPVT